MCSRSCTPTFPGSDARVPKISDDEAREIARSHLGLPRHIPAGSWLVYRLDRLGEAYYLVLLGESTSSVGVATIDADSGSVLSSASLPGTQPIQFFDSSSALEAADLPPDTPRRLVWKPFRGSRSMSDPFWELRGSDALVYVDQRGRVWRSLERGIRGG
jgi:hypothetical protein